MQIYNIHSQSQQDLINKLSDIPALLAYIFQIVSTKSRAWRYFRVFNAILSYINSKVIYPTREQLAKAAGCSVEVVSDAIKFLEEKGWLREVKRRYKSSNIYYISLIFYHIPLRKYLARIFPACALFLKWEYAIRVNAAGAVIQRTGTLLYIEDIRVTKKHKKKRQPCIILPRRASEPLLEQIYLKTHNQPPTGGIPIVEGDGMRMIIAKVADMVQLADEQLAHLDAYSDAAIQKALNKLKGAKDVKSPAAYFMHILRNDAGLEHQKHFIKQQLASSSDKNRNHQQERQHFPPFGNSFELEKVILGHNPGERKAISNELLDRWNKSELEHKDCEQKLAEARENKLPTAPFLECVLKILRKSADDILDQLVKVDLIIFEEEEKLTKE